MTCSQLSSTRTTDRSPSRSIVRSSGRRGVVAVVGGRVATAPTVDAMASGTAIASVTGASSTYQTSRRARQLARDLEDDPGLADAGWADHGHEAGTCRSAAWSSASSGSRPTNEVSGIGRVFDDGGRHER